MTSVAAGITSLSLKHGNFIRHGACFRDATWRGGKSIGTEVQAFRGTRKSFILPPDLAESIKALNGHEGATFLMTLLAALQVLLFRYTGTEDVVAGSPVTNLM